VRYHPLGIGMVNDKVYVANNGSTSDPTTVSVISAASLTKVKDIPTQSCGGYAMNVATNPNTGLVYVTLYGNARVAVIDSNTDTIIACVTVETNPFGIAVHVPSNTIYVGNRAGLDLWKINGTTNQAERLFRYSDGRGGGAPYTVYVNPAMTKLFVTVGLPSSDNPNKLFVYDIDSLGNLSNETKLSIGDTGEGGFIAQSQCGLIYIAETADNTVRVLNADLSLNTVLDGAQGIGEGPYGMLTSPLQRLYVANKYSNTFTVLPICR
jgi:YVTN family beta-propeller protein